MAGKRQHFYLLFLIMIFLCYVKSCSLKKIYQIMLIFVLFAFAFFFNFSQK